MKPNSGAIKFINNTKLPLLLLLLSISLSFLVAEFSAKQEIARSKFELNRVADARVRSINQYFENLPLQVKLIAGTHLVKEFSALYTIGYGKKLERDLGDFFSSFMSYNKDIVQVRIISFKNGGREIFRVNKTDLRPSVVLPSHLQFKGDTDYYKKTIRLKSGQVYISEFNLNKENGVIERPFNPVFRVSSPIYDKNENLIAIIVVNYTTKEIFQNMSYGLPEGMLAYIVNDKGDFIYHKNPNLVYGFDLGHRHRWSDYYKLDEDMKVEDSSPVFWKSIQSERILVKSREIKVGGIPRLILYLTISNSSIEKNTHKILFFTFFISVVVSVICLLTYAVIFKQKNKTLLQQKQLAAVISSVNDAIISMSPDGKVLSWNNGAHALFGYSEAEAIGKYKYELVGTHSIDAERRVIFDKVLNGHVHEIKDTTRFHKDGHLLFVSVKASPVKNEFNQVVSIVESIHDISLDKEEKKKAREINALLESQVADRTKELEVALLKANEASKTKSDFMANISHEVRTPMNAILGVAALLLKTKLDMIQRKYLNMLNVSGRSLLILINDILDFSKIEAGQLQLNIAHFKLKDCIDTISSTMSTLVGDKNIDLIIVIDENLPEELIGDVQRINQLLINLVGNAIKFTDSGEVVLTARKINASDNEVTIEFSVRDTGIGISLAQQEKLFEPFFQADSSVSRRFGGTGLGLSISKKIAALMGGNIIVNSSEGEGSEFLAILKLKKIDKPQLSEVFFHKKNILVVDNSEIGGINLKNLIERINCTADVVSSGLSAVSKLRDSVESEYNYDLILIDIDMPEVSGMQTYELISDQCLAVNVPIVMMGKMSDQYLINDKLESFELNGFLIKPITCSSLFDALITIFQPNVQGDDIIKNNEQSLHGINLLLVEDNPANQFIAKALLEQAGAIVNIKNNGNEAINELLINPNCYDLVLMDIQMPVLDGLSATRILRNDMGFMQPILAMSAGVMDDERQRCIEAGMNDFITKPINLNEMIGTIKRYVNQKSVLDGEVLGLDNSIADKSFDAPFFAIDEIFSLSTDSDFVSMIIAQVDKFVAESLASLDAVDMALATGNFEDAKRRLHTLRGSYGSLGARRFAELTLHAEELIQQNSDSAVLKIMNELRDVLISTIKIARKWLAKHSK